MGSRISIATVASVGIFAFGLEAVVHEVLGHAVVCWLTGGKVILISSTAMQTASASRLVPAAGPLANILFGIASLAFLQVSASHNRKNERAAANEINIGKLFLYFFAFANLFLAAGYILYSGSIRFGDFAAVTDAIRHQMIARG